MKKDKIFDEWLVLRYKSGDVKAIPILVERWHNKMIMYIDCHINDKESAKDLAQDCWIAILKGLNRLKKPKNFGAWVLSIAHKKAMDYLRRRKKLESVVTTVSKESQTDESYSDYKELVKAMKTLSIKHRNVLKLFYLQGFSLDEIVTITGNTKGTVKSQLFYARNNLKEKLKI